MGSMYSKHNWLEKFPGLYSTRRKSLFLENMAANQDYGSISLPSIEDLVLFCAIKIFLKSMDSVEVIKESPFRSHGSLQV